MNKNLIFKSIFLFFYFSLNAADNNWFDLIGKLDSNDLILIAEYTKYKSERLEFNSVKKSMMENWPRFQELNNKNKIFKKIIQSMINIDDNHRARTIRKYKSKFNIKIFDMRLRKTWKYRYELIMKNCSSCKLYNKATKSRYAGVIFPEDLDEKCKESYDS